jgi:tetratricopeptide (TPR) repeat protein
MRPANRCLLFAALGVLIFHGAGAAQDGSPRELADRARDLARAGSVEESLDLYRRALASAPDDVEIRRDYAVALGWAERYADSIAEFRKLVQEDPDQPEWALAEFARSELFGGSPAKALRILDSLVQAGDDSEATLCRKALALRWLGRPGKAEQAYRAVLGVYPGSTTARLGLIYSLADQDRLEHALAEAESAMAAAPDDWDLLKARGQVLNWMGRHRAAMRVFSGIPGSREHEREVLEGRIAAARWGGRPKLAKETARTLSATFPSHPPAAKLKRDIFLDYGRALAPGFRFATDRDGFTDRLYEQSFSLHAGPANRFQFGLQHRQFSMDRNLSWNRYEAGWSGRLTSRLAAYASLSNVEYRVGVPMRRLLGDGSLFFDLTDRVRLSAGSGTIAADAFHAVQKGVTAPFFYGSAVLHPRRDVAIETQYSRHMFSNGVRRERYTVEGFRRLGGARRFRVDVGGAGNWMWHDRTSGDFFSPESFHSLLGKMRASGRLSSRLEYIFEAGSGAQHETGLARQTPLVLTGSLFARLAPGLHLRVDAGRTTSSLERVNPGLAPYSRTVVAASLMFRFE